MKNSFFYLAIFFLLGSGLGLAQSNNSIIKEGDTFKIAEVQNNKYEAIHFPKANFIIKKGGIYSYDRIINEKVEIHSVEEKNDGTTIATIKRSSKGKFFNSHKYIKVDIKKALETGELIRM